MIETDRLILREYTMDDFESLYEIVSDPETMKHYPAPFDEERTRGWLFRAGGRYSAALHLFSVYCAADGDHGFQAPDRALLQRPQQHHLRGVHRVYCLDLPQRVHFDAQRGALLMP